MQLNRFDLNLLIALDALLREKNVTRAAERVFVSQPAMSAALHKLREYFNDPLLVRVGREMELTSRGEMLVEPVREALLRIQMMLGTQPTFDPKTARREFTVIMSEEAVPGVLPPLLRTRAREVAEIVALRGQPGEIAVRRLGHLRYGQVHGVLVRSALVSLVGFLGGVAQDVGARCTRARRAHRNGVADRAVATRVR